MLKVARTAPESNDATERGEYDFVYSNTIFLPKMAKSNYQVILRPHEAAITGQIVTLTDSPIRTLKDLEGLQAAARADHCTDRRRFREGFSALPEFRDG